MATKKTSYPRNKIRILLLENISASAVAELRAAGYTDIRQLGGALSEADLIEAVRGVHMLGIRSKTRITEKVIEAGDKLLAVGAFCIGVNQIDLGAAARHGVAVFNAPHANTRSVAELIIGLSVMLIRRITEKNAAAHEGRWLKEVKGSYELRGKTLGIVGYGNIGSQVSIMAEAMGMTVIYYDIAPKLPHGNAHSMRDLAEVLRAADIVTLHVPSDATTHNMINERTLKLMRRGSILINYSRGDVVVIDALRKALASGRLSGAAIDVFPEEPEKIGDLFSSPLQGLSNVILTPHIGGSTEEAQANIGRDVTAKLIRFLDFGTSEGSHTVPAVSLPPQTGTHRILHIHRNIPGIMSQINSRLSKNKINIAGQYLKTNDSVGYVILDVDASRSHEAFEILRGIKGTIRERMVY